MLDRVPSEIPTYLTAAAAPRRRRRAEILLRVRLRIQIQLRAVRHEVLQPQVQRRAHRDPVPEVHGVSAASLA